MLTGGLLALVVVLLAVVVRATRKHTFGEGCWRTILVGLLILAGGCATAPRPPAGRLPLRIELQGSGVTSEAKVPIDKGQMFALYGLAGLVVAGASDGYDSEFHAGNAFARQSRNVATAPSSSSVVAIKVIGFKHAVETEPEEDLEAWIMWQMALTGTSGIRRSYADYDCVLPLRASSIDAVDVQLEEMIAYALGHWASRWEGKGLTLTADGAQFPEREKGTVATEGIECSYELFGTMSPKPRTVPARPPPGPVRHPAGAPPAKREGKSCDTDFDCPKGTLCVGSAANRTCQPR